MDASHDFTTVLVTCCHPSWKIPLWHGTCRPLCSVLREWFEAHALSPRGRAPGSVLLRRSAGDCQSGTSLLEPLLATARPD